MDVVPAGVHQPDFLAVEHDLFLGGEGQACLLRDRQGVHVPAKADDRSRLRAAEHAEDSGAADPRSHLEPELPEIVGDEGGGPHFSACRIRDGNGYRGGSRSATGPGARQGFRFWRPGRPCRQARRPRKQNDRQHCGRYQLWFFHRFTSRLGDDPERPDGESRKRHGGLAALDLDRRSFRPLRIDKLAVTPFPSRKTLLSRESSRAHSSAAAGFSGCRRENR